MKGDLLLREFMQRFGEESEEVHLAVAPGRVNIIGEHIDYNGGPVLPMTVNLHVQIAFRRRNDETVRLFSTISAEEISFALSDTEKMKRSGWASYVAGVCHFMMQEGVEFPGFDACIGGDLPIGIGLSSSAAIECATAVALLHLAETHMDPVKTALLCQKAEHEFGGVMCGIMDQFASMLGSEKGPLYIDCSSLEYQQLELPAGVDVVVCDSRVKHSLGDSEYNRRRMDCEEGLKFFQQYIKGLKFLSQVPLGELKAMWNKLPRRTARRVRHVITETKRTKEARKALLGGNPVHLGILMEASHASLRDDFEVSCPELDCLVEIAQETEGVFGSRMTGGGFGGCTVTLVDSTKTSILCDRLEEGYFEQFGRRPDVYVVKPSPPAGVKRPEEVSK